ncbi:MAG TPA: hypothetical protein VGD19_12670 [Allosphingosinicella sp.]|jgi:hypothetical protein
MDIKKKLQNPFALVVQGFIAGAILFWSTNPPEAEATDGARPVQAAALAQNLDA